MNKWEDKGENSLWLLTPEEMARVPDGVEVESILEEKYIKGVDKLDDDTRAGHLAYGIRNPFNHPNEELRQLFVLFKLMK